MDGIASAIQSALSCIIHAFMLRAHMNERTLLDIVMRGAFVYLSLSLSLSEWPLTIMNPSCMWKLVEIMIEKFIFKLKIWCTWESQGDYMGTNLWALGVCQLDSNIDVIVSITEGINIDNYVTLLRSITMFCGIDIISWNIPEYFPHSYPTHVRHDIGSQPVAWPNIQ